MKTVGYILCLLLLPDLAAWASSIDNPCYGPGAFLNIVDRPNNAESVCAIPEGHSEFEMGYEYQRVGEPNGTQQNYPSFELRFGLPHDSELFIQTPNYTQQNVDPKAGFSQTVAGLKHEFWFNDRWQLAMEGVGNLPDGSRAFGNQGLGLTWNAIVSYSLSDRLNATTMLGISSLTDPRLNGGQRYSSFNPDLVLSWAFTDKINGYVEVYGQTKTGHDAGSGYNFDAGLLYLIRPNLILDISGAQRLSGFSGEFERYAGAGLSVMM